LGIASNLTLPKILLLIHFVNANTITLL